MTFTGQMPHDSAELSDLYQGARVHVLPELVRDHRTGLTRSRTERMQCGVDVTRAREGVPVGSCPLLQPGRAGIDPERRARGWSTPPSPDAQTAGRGALHLEAGGQSKQSSGTVRCSNVVGRQSARLVRRLSPRLRRYIFIRLRLLVLSSLNAGVPRDAVTLRRPQEGCPPVRDLLDWTWAPGRGGRPVHRQETLVQLADRTEYFEISGEEGHWQSNSEVRMRVRRRSGSVRRNDRCLAGCTFPSIGWPEVAWSCVHLWASRRSASTSPTAPWQTAWPNWAWPSFASITTEPAIRAAPRPIPVASRRGWAA